MITQFEVDGVPALFGSAAGPMRAGLMFRVGTADEPLARSGITHLIEHLALYGLGVADYHYNGTTGAEETSFHMQGSPQDVVRFLNGVCTALHALPMHRVPVEKDLLRAEENSRSGGVSGPLRLWRHGARGYGVPAYPELGLPAISEDDLRYWAARYFTRDNAVLWIAGEGVPADLRLELPAGRREPLPEPSCELPVMPAYFRDETTLVGWSALVRRDAASPVFADVLEQAMFRGLRQEAGLSYTVMTHHQPIGADGALVEAVADAVPEAHSAVLGGFVDVLAALRAGCLDPADVDMVIRRRCEALQQAEERGDRLAGQAANLLAGRPVRQVEEAVAETAAVTPADVVAVAGAACATGLLMAPEGTSGEWAGFHAAPSTSETVVIGTAYPSLDGADVHLIVAEDGVTLVGGAKRLTVRFATCAIVRAWPDGGRQLIGHDGIVLNVEPTMFRDGRQAVAWMDAHLPPGLRVDQPPRDPDRIPAAPVPAPPAPAVQPQRAERRISATGAVLTLMFLSGLVRLGLSIREKAGDRVFAAVLLAVLVVAVVAGRVVLANRRSRRA